MFHAYQGGRKKSPRLWIRTTVSLHSGRLFGILTKQQQRDKQMNLNQAATPHHPAITRNSHTALVTTLFLLFAIPGIPAILIVSLVLLGPFDSPTLMSLINARYFETPWAVLVHGSSSAVFFLTVPWQFSDRFRYRTPKWHRISGRLVLLSAYVMALSGIWMHHSLTPDELGMRYVGMLLLSLGIVLAFTLAFYYVLQGQIAAHRRWMYRAVAIALASVTPLFLEVIADISLGQLAMFKPVLPSLLHDYDRLVAVGLNLLIVQWLLRQQTTQNTAQNAAQGAA